MKQPILRILVVTISFGLGYFLHDFRTKTHQSRTINQVQKTTNPIKKKNMKLGAFSVSLSVKDIKTSKKFYESLGFVVLAGDLEKNYLIMKNENSLIGLFQGMFENNILTFNPGWDENGKNTEQFDDIREIQHQLLNNAIQIENKIDEKTAGPASLMITDPDGNVILLDQHR